MSLKAIINGTGRGVIGWISDRYGRRNTLIIVCLVLGSAQFAVFFSGSIGSMPLFLFCSMVSGFGGGAIFPLFAAMTADYFGENNNATNYGLVYSSKVDLRAWSAPAWVRSWSALGLRRGVRHRRLRRHRSAVLAVFLRAPGRPKKDGVRTAPAMGAVAGEAL